MSTIVNDLLAAARRYDGKTASTISDYQAAKKAAEDAGYRVREPGNDPKKAFATTTAFLKDEPEPSQVVKPKDFGKVGDTAKDHGAGAISGKN